MNTTSFTPNKSAGRHTAYLTPTNGHLVAAFEAAADKYIALLAESTGLDGPGDLTAVDDARGLMAAAREAVLASTAYRNPAIPAAAPQSNLDLAEALLRAIGGYLNAEPDGVLSTDDIEAIEHMSWTLFSEYCL